jgi:hypothetical protein
MLRVLAILMAVTLAGVCSAGDSVSDAEALVHNLAQWRNLGIKNYTFLLHFTGHVPAVGSLPAARVRVRNAVVIDARLLGPLELLRAGSQAPRDPYVARYFRMTVEELFAEAVDSIEYGRAHPGAAVRITYDPKFGFPDKIDVEDPDVSDSDGEFLVDDFEIVR